MRRPLTSSYEASYFYKEIESQNISLQNNISQLEQLDVKLPHICSNFMLNAFNSTII